MIAARKPRKKRRKAGTGQSKPLTPRQQAALKIAIRAAARARKLRAGTGSVTRKRRRRRKAR
ncbi:hypothetical protein PBI_DAMIEN_7 [Mycobacterium phage Damien]|uniref:Uncharacterized protein n=1 Tax=Mycobacterium phage Konstantine TaxID=563121 RepID=B5U4Y2_9CAUD|nr:gp12 [Mycobacterium phage Konstantine]YP_009043996.1 hypothetical protein HL12_gp07 [Mycobacterium phage Damien]ACI12428.1 hypothetical protein KONSTANTINE_12 [Mycobacterium phage Konstantine]AHZ95368.1 hypothetical protein PBI_DAMIEN_7 [Mycobacterium phage Damien]AXH47133.1 hypothetical protein SEA_CBORCH11_8 [Mycobacterium phage Cborch11]